MKLNTVEGTRGLKDRENYKNDDMTCLSVSMATSTAAPDCTRPFVSFCRRKGGLKTATESTFSEDSKLLQLFNGKAQVVAMHPRLGTCRVPRQTVDGCSSLEKKPE